MKIESKKVILKLIAKIGMNSAIKAAGAASTFGYHQASEPKSLNNVKKS